jgi:hypothetical protein
MPGICCHCGPKTSWAVIRTGFRASRAAIQAGIAALYVVVCTRSACRAERMARGIAISMKR